MECELNNNILLDNSTYKMVSLKQDSELEILKEVRYEESHGGWLWSLHG
jgi:hypothetical protein